LREPTGNDLVAAGYPLSFGVGNRTEVDAGAMTRLIGKVSGIPEANVGMLPACDWQACCLVVMGFFAPPAEENPPAP
jgi:Phage tail assembly chaperone proteins, E, or 41 or 14